MIASRYSWQSRRSWRSLKNTFRVSDEVLEETTSCTWETSDRLCNYDSTIWRETGDVVVQTSSRSPTFDIICHSDRHVGVISSIQAPVSGAGHAWLSLVSWGSRRARWTWRSEESCSRSVTWKQYNQNNILDVFSSSNN